MMSVSNNLSPSSTQMLRSWDVPYSDKRLPTSARPARPGPRGRGNLPQLSRLDHAPQLPPQFSPHNTTGSQQFGKLSDDKKFNSTHAWGAGESLLGESSSRGISLTQDEKERFYGSLSGSQIEIDLKQHATLLKTLLHDVTMMKNSIWHLEEEQCQVSKRIDEFETTEPIKKLVEDENAQAKMDNLSLQIADMTIRMLTCEKSKDMSNKLPATIDTLLTRADIVTEQLAGLSCRIAHIETRFTTCESPVSLTACESPMCPLPNDNQPCESPMSPLSPLPKDNHRPISVTSGSEGPDAWEIEVASEVDDSARAFVGSLDCWPNAENSLECTTVATSSELPTATKGVVAREEALISDLLAKPATQQTLKSKIS